MDPATIARINGEDDALYRAIYEPPRREVGKRFCMVALAVLAVVSFYLVASL